MPERARVVVIGAGAFGGWAALHLLRKGARVTLVDAWGPGNSRASSGGETRITRAAYGASRLYARMNADSQRMWSENQASWGVRLYFPIGGLWMAGKNDSFEVASIEAMQELGIRHQRLTAAECARRWPQINFDGVSYCIFEPDAGFVLARRACEAVLEAFLDEGGEYQQAEARPGRSSKGRLDDITLNRGERLAAEQFVFACGPWLPQMFPVLKDLVRPTKQELFFFGAPAGAAEFTEERLPIWIDNGDKLFYGVPGNKWRGFKLGDDSRGPDFDPTNGERRISEERLADARAYMEMRFPGMRGAPLVESRVCQYENSPDHDLILDRHPELENTWIAGGGSGHGFKHGPAVGEMVAQAVLGEKAPPKEFALARLLQK